MNKLNKEQIKQFKEGFAVFDKNGDGKITADELFEVMKTIGQKKTFRECQQMIARVDKDGSGHIDINEFYLMMSGTVGSTEEDIENAFKVFDTDGNGYISKTELKHALTKCGTYKFTNKQIEKMMEKVDSDKDGRVCYEEFIELLNHLQ